MTDQQNVQQHCRIHHRKSTFRFARHKTWMYKNGSWNNYNIQFSQATLSSHMTDFLDIADLERTYSRLILRSFIMKVKLLCLYLWPSATALVDSIGWGYDLAHFLIELVCAMARFWLISHCLNRGQLNLDSITFCLLGYYSLTYRTEIGTFTRDPEGFQLLMWCFHTDSFLTSSKEPLLFLLIE